MKVPSLLATRPFVSLNGNGLMAAPGAPLLNSHVILGYEKVAQYQLLSMWCWNAVGASITQFYLSAGGKGQLIQCENASKALQGVGHCCSIKIPGYPSKAVPYIKQGKPIAHDAGNIPCNQGGWPEEVIHASKRLSSSWVQYGAGGPTPAEVQMVVTSIKNGDPVVMYIAWNSDGAHVQTLYGTHLSGGKRYFHVADPWDGLSIDREDQLCPGGVWGMSMFTTPQPLGSPLV